MPAVHVATQDGDLVAEQDDLNGKLTVVVPAEAQQLDDSGEGEVEKRQGRGPVSCFRADSRKSWSTLPRSDSRHPQGDLATRAVLTAVRDTFVTPISPVDIYEISERLDAVLNAAKNLVRESELVDMDPDPPMAEMAELVGLGLRDLVRAFPCLSSDPDRATQCADAAVK